MLSMLNPVILKNECHICLDDRITAKSNSKCKNENCNAYICNSCWNDLIKNDIKMCPICREDLVIIKSCIPLRLVLLHISINILGFLILTIFHILYGVTIKEYSIKLFNLSYLEFFIFIIVMNSIGLLFAAIIYYSYNKLKKFI